MRLLPPLFLCLFLFACGVKALPIAPQRSPEPPKLNLDCSPSDAECDKTDPNYKKHGY
jgi:hypothetical protein